MNVYLYMYIYIYYVYLLILNKYREDKPKAKIFKKEVTSGKGRQETNKNKMEGKV